MADDSGMIASAVVVPDVLNEGQQSPSVAAPSKRRQSSVSEAERKRPRLDTENITNSDVRDGEVAPDDPTPTTLAGETPTLESPNTAGSDHAAGDGGRRRSEVPAKDEERRRGKRLFGALLGTLSQSSSSSAQRRRADIDKKQQAKLKLQAEEYDELKRKEIDDIIASRKEQQKEYDLEVMKTRHANMLATANFLQTKAEPKLYYKPWELRQDDKEIIEKQVEEAKAQVERERQEAGLSRDEEEDPRPQPSLAQADGAADSPPTGASDTVGTNHEEVADDPASTVNADTNQDTDATNVEPIENGPDITKDTVEDNEEMVVEAGEDPVIY